MEIEEFLRLHKPQLLASNVPEHLWVALHEKLTKEIFDVGEHFVQLLIDSDSEDDDDSGDEAMLMSAVKNEKGLRANDPKNIFLVDHAWTFQLPYVRSHLMQIPNLLERVAAMMHVDVQEREKTQVIEEVMEEMWRYIQTYQFSNATKADSDVDLEPMWYLVDEFGVTIHHSDDPTVAMVPFLYIPTGVVYSVFWLLRDLECRDEISRDFAQGVTNQYLRTAKLYPWQSGELDHQPWQPKPVPDQFFKDICPSEAVPPRDITQGLSRLSLSDDDSVLTVYTDITQLKAHLTHPKFKVVDSTEQADIWWLQKHFKEYSTFATQCPKKFINQFCNESLLTMKASMAAVARRAKDISANHTGPGKDHSKSDCLATSPSWLPTTYNLNTEMVEFVSYYQNREARGLDNHWIVKPWNMARGIDMRITNSLDAVIRLAESNPKVACKYIENPVLFHRPDVGGSVKFDVRYIVMLANTKPLKLYAYKVFWLRFANKVYELKNLDDYEKHFTVMNYKEDSPLKQMHYDEFIPAFESQYKQHKWADVERDIFSMLRELFTAACSAPHPAGIPPSPQSRAIYAVDLMLTWDNTESGTKRMRPMLCEVNFCPDCERACKYHPNFYNDVFSTLFLQDIQDRPVAEIS